MPKKSKPGLPPTHPGEILREDVVPSLGLTKVAIAERLGISRQTFYDLLNEATPVTTNLALRIAKLTGSRPGFWLDLQQAHDIATLEVELATELAAIEPVKEDGEGVGQ